MIRTVPVICLPTGPSEPKLIRKGKKSGSQNCIDLFCHPTWDVVTNQELTVQVASSETGGTYGNSASAVTDRAHGS